MPARYTISVWRRSIGPRLRPPPLPPRIPSCPPRGERRECRQPRAERRGGLRLRRPDHELRRSTRSRPRLACDQAVERVALATAEVVGSLGVELAAGDAHDQRELAVTRRQIDGRVP